MDFIEILKAVFLGIIQGITEWLPISSTGHMILADEFLKLDVFRNNTNFKDLFLVVIQLGSILAVLVLYFHKLNPFSPKKSALEKKGTLSLWGKVIIGSVPIGIIGLLFEKKIDALFYNYKTVAISLIVYGVFFIILENRNKHLRPRLRSVSDLNYKTALLIGVFQVLALIPGTSRSGSTILGAMLLGTSRTISAEFSFFLAIPAMFGASFIKIVKYGFSYTGAELAVLLIGTIVSFLVSIVAIKFLMNFIRKHNFKPFGYYRIILGIAVILYFTFIAK